MQCNRYKTMGKTEKAISRIKCFLKTNKQIKKRWQPATVCSSFLSAWCLSTCFKGKQATYVPKPYGQLRPPVFAVVLPSFLLNSSLFIEGKVQAEGEIKRPSLGAVQALLSSSQNSSVLSALLELQIQSASCSYHGS